MKKIALRMDDVGASTKLYEVYSKIPLGNFLFLKYLRPFKAWAPYQELSADQWKNIIDILDKYNAKLTVGITASWVNKDSSSVPFPEKFPNQAELIKDAYMSGLLEVANHGLTHCVVGKHLPRLFTSNRKYHREFWDWLPQEIHDEHILKSQDIFNSWLGLNLKVLIPPGNVYSEKTLSAAESNGIKMINSSVIMENKTNVVITDETFVDPFHDREISLMGVGWLEKKIKKHKEKEFKFVGELC